MRKTASVFFFGIVTGFVYPKASFAQQGRLHGTVADANTGAPVPGATALLLGTELGDIADTNGAFTIRGIQPGTYNLKVQALGFESRILDNVVITTGNDASVFVTLSRSNSTALKEVVVRTNPFGKPAESPLSVQSLSAEEIKSNPGGNFDISRVIQGFPGVGGTSGSVGGYRNDIIIRGGAPNENVYYLDDVEVPVINHFATQGSAGGPTGILNIAFINDADLFTSAFPARYDNPLSGVLQLKQKDPNPERVEANVRLSATEVAFSADGPLTDQSGFQVSARRSYLQLLFQALQIPIQPSYWDFQYKYKWKISKRLSFYTIGVGAIDRFSFLTPGTLSPENIYILHSNPLINQWSYTNGYVLKKQTDKGFWNLVFSRNMLDNEIDKYLDNQHPTDASRTLKIHSTEAENKLRFEHSTFNKNWSCSYGAMVQYDEYRCDFYDQLRQEILDTFGQVVQPAVTLTSYSNFGFFRYGAFGQAAYHLAQDHLVISAGLRTDGNTFTHHGNDLGRQLSPRVAITWRVNEHFHVNASAGKYFKLPPYTLLGYQSAPGVFTNQGESYLACRHLVAGIEFLPAWQGARATVEAFDKQYTHYPISLIDQVSVANEGGDFNVLGNEPVSSNGLGHSHGIEIQLQQKFLTNFFAVFSLTWYRSEFTNGNAQWYPASWDNRQLISFIGGYKFRRNYELGIKFRYQGGAPYTPFDLAASQANYVTLGTGITDYTQFNSQRLAAFHSLDARIDKKWNRPKWGIDLFFDMTNVFGSLQPAAPSYTFARTADNKQFLTTDGKPLKNDGSNAVPFILDNSSRISIPSIGFILTF